MIPRPEFPRPQFYRGEASWINLNGEWDFELDLGASGHERRMHEREYTGKITVPFAPESKLSGIEYTDFIAACWYRRRFERPAGFDGKRERLLLHFGAVDYEATVWVNLQKIGYHMGGYTPFTVDITDVLQENNTVCVWAKSDVRSPLQPSGKQAMRYPNEGCMYTRSTGIWQTVWLERVPRTYIESVRMTPDVANEKLDVRVTLAGDTEAKTVRATVSYKGESVAETEAAICGRSAVFSVPVKNPHLWDIGKPELYDIRFTCGDDVLDSYFGMRSVELDGYKFLLNGRSVFQRLVLDQGYYPDGIYTAPNDGALKRDIELSMSAGFNGARLHMKIFEPRLIYHADHMGYLLWGEYPNWGLDTSLNSAMEAILPEWLEELERDYSSPAIIGWCPTNEIAPNRDKRLMTTLYNVTHSFDPYRPVIDSSGYHHVVTDIYDVHNYDQNPENFRKAFEPLVTGEGEVFVNNPREEKYEGQPYFVSEYGGARLELNAEGGEGWGYGDAPKDYEEFYARLEGLTSALLENPRICAFCYTQLTDVFQEENGIFGFDRCCKFDMERIRGIFSAPAAIEKD